MELVRKTVWKGLCAALAVGVGIALSLTPWQHYREQRIRANDAARAMREAEAEKVALLREQARVGSPAGKEELARARGYSRPGELRLKLDP